jgi:hypothetical protein
MPPDVATLATVASAPSAPPSGTPPAASPQQPAKPAAAKPVAPDARAWAEMSPDARAVHQRAELDRQAGRGPEHLHTRAADGTPLIDGKRADGSTYQPDGAPAPADSAAPANTGEKFKVGSKFEVTEAELEAMMARQAQDDLRKATLPASPELYEAKLPEGLKLPGGIEFRIDVNDPSLADARRLAHARGWSQQDFSDALGIFASHQAQQQALIAEAAQREIAKAGSNAGARVDAIGKWIRSEIGDVDAKPILASLCTDSHLRFYERMQAKITNQGVAGFSGKHRDVDTGKLSDEQYSKLSYSEKKAYSERMSSQGNGRR